MVHLLELRKRKININIIFIQQQINMQGIEHSFFESDININIRLDWLLENVLMQKTAFETERLGVSMNYYAVSLKFS